VLVSGFVSGFVGLVISVAVSIISVCLSVYALGITKEERSFVNQKVKEKLKL
jgi:mannose/fructose/N-acetylgalactosamine-specific phosphotransferase system component IIC